MKKRFSVAAGLLAVMVILGACSAGSEGSDASSSESSASSSSQTSTTGSSESGAPPSSQEQRGSGDPDENEEEMELVQFSEIQDGEELVVLKTSMGDITIRFFPELAPKAVENFTTHARNGYFNGLIFHRVVDEFVIQSGDPTGIGTGGQSIWGEPFDDEFNINLRHFRGALGMAKSSVENNKSQFYIVQNSAVDPSLIEQMTAMQSEDYSQEVIDKYAEIGGTPTLDFRYTVFAMVVDGMDVVDAIAAVETVEEKPAVPVIIEEVVFITYEAKNKAE